VVAADVSVVGLVALIVLAGHPERLGIWAGRLASRLPAKAAAAVGNLVNLRGAQSCGPGHLAVAVFWSLPLWLSIALGIQAASWAFYLSISFVGSFLVVGYLAVGVAAPTPGAAGGFHGMYLLALTQFFDAPADVAGAAAIVLHLVSFVPVTILGLIFMWQDGLTLVVSTMRSVKLETSRSKSLRG
jgi:uncharacterized membrane protein YbhN (UPF0104 family)